MNDAEITTIVTGFVTVTLAFIGFLSVWVKLRYGAAQAEEAVKKAATVEKKLDDNTATTNAVDIKTDTIVKQTNGTLDKMMNLILKLGDRVEKLENYNHESYHRLANAVMETHLTVAVLAGKFGVDMPAKILANTDAGDKK